MFTKGVFVNRIGTQNTPRFFNTFSMSNCINRLKELFPKHSVTSLQEGQVLFGCNKMKLIESTLALRNPSQMAQLVKQNEIHISEVRLFTVKKTLDEVIQVEDKIFVPFDLVKPHREINDNYLNLFKLDNEKSLGL